MKRRTAEPETQAAAAPPAPVVHSSFDIVAHSALPQHMVGPRSREEVEAHYVAARDEWTKAMRLAGSGRPADLATLALTQEAFEAAAAERERWITGVHAAIPIEPDRSRRGLEAAVGQEMAWRRVRHHEKPEGFLDRLKRRITR